MITERPPCDKKYSARKRFGKNVFLDSVDIDIPNENDWRGENLSVGKACDETHLEKKKSWGEKFAMRTF